MILSILEYNCTIRLFGLKHSFESLFMSNDEVEQLSICYSIFGQINIKQLLKLGVISDDGIT